MNLFQISILALIQGAAELLPVSSSAHVVFAERLMGLDPSTPEMTFLLVMLHTGTMFAVLLYFWPRWMARWREARGPLVLGIVLATAVTGAVGLGLKTIIEKILLAQGGAGEVEELFRSLPLIAGALFAVGLLILWAARAEQTEGGPLTHRRAAWVGAVQGLCLPFRGFSRSGATISAGLLLGLRKPLAEDFSFALAVVLTPPVIVHSARRLARAAAEGAGLGTLWGPGLVGMVLSFVAGWIALRWLSAWLEHGRWKFFGYYCLGFAALLLTYHFVRA